MVIRIIYRVHAFGHLEVVFEHFKDSSVRRRNDLCQTLYTPNSKFDYIDTPKNSYLSGPLLP